MCLVLCMSMILNEPAVIDYKVDRAVVGWMGNESNGSFHILILVFLEYVYNSL